MKKNLAISFVVFLLLYVFLEATFLYWFPRVFPTNLLLMSMDEGIQPALQSSKSSVVPSDYIGLFGDSYAQGMGDWATQEMTKPMAHYGSASLLHDLTGRDVVTFGSAGAGSIRGIVTEPLTQLAYLRQYIDSDFPDPSVALIFFYEGNDLYDNAAYFHYSFPRLFDINQQYSFDTYRKYLQGFALERDTTWKIAQRNDISRHFSFAVFLDKNIRQLLGVAQRKEPVEAIDESLDPPWIFGGTQYKQPGKINRARIAGADVQLPDRLQGPAVNLDEEEWKQSWFALEQALIFAQDSFPASRLIMVYIPSVISTYSMIGDQVSMQSYERRGGIFPLVEVENKSARMRETLKSLSVAHNISLIDTTDKMRVAAQKEFLHGPGDWNHLNRRGYEVLSQSIYDQLPAYARRPESDNIQGH